MPSEDIDRATLAPDRERHFDGGLPANARERSIRLATVAACASSRSRSRFSPCQRIRTSIVRSERHAQPLHIRREGRSTMPRSSSRSPLAGRRLVAPGPPDASHGGCGARATTGRSGPSPRGRIVGAAAPALNRASTIARRWIAREVRRRAPEAAPRRTLCRGRCSTCSTRVRPLRRPAGRRALARRRHEVDVDLPRARPPQPVRRLASPARARPPARRPDPHLEPVRARAAGCLHRGDAGGPDPRPARPPDERRTRSGRSSPAPSRAACSSAPGRTRRTRRRRASRTSRRRPSTRPRRATPDDDAARRLAGSRRRRLATPATRGVWDLIFTSGTTGTPKGVMVAHDNLLATMDAIGHVIPPLDHRIISVLPLSHLFEQAIGLIYALSVGADILYVRSRNPRDPVRGAPGPSGDEHDPRAPGARPVLERDRARGRPDGRAPSSTASGLARHLPYPLAPPALPERPCAARRQPQPLRELRRVPPARAPAGLGGSRGRRRPGLRQQRERVRHLHDARGSRARARSAGRCPRSSSAIADDGEVLFRGPTLFKGYWQDPEATARTIDPDGWYHTGDIGHLDPGGRLILSGRTKDRIVLPNGFKVYPEDIENALRDRRHPRRRRARDRPRPDRGDRRSSAACGARRAEAAKPVIDPAVRDGERRVSGPSSGSPAGGSGPRTTSRGPTP